MFGFGKKDADNDWFEKLSKAQLKNRTTGAYIPVPEGVLKNSDAAFEREYKSFAFTSLIPTYRSLVSPIIYLHSSAKAMFLVGEEWGGRIVPPPSHVFEAVSSDLLQVLDAAIDDTPTDLLILHERWHALDFDRVDRDAVLARAAEIESDDHCHSLARYHARLLRNHLSEGGRGRFVAYRRAISALELIGLFHEGEVGPLALDMFPSLARRVDELIARREALGKERAEP